MLLKENDLHGLNTILTKAEVQRIETAVKVILTYTNAYKDISKTAVEQDTLLLNESLADKKNIDYVPTQSEYVQGEAFNNLRNCERGATAYTMGIMEQVATLQGIIKECIRQNGLHSRFNTKNAHEWQSIYNNLCSKAEAEENEG